MKQTKTLKLAQIALFTALIIILAFVPYIGYIRVPILAIQATTVHIPVIIGSILLGPKAGGFLGGVFGLTSLINNTMQPGITSFCFSPFIQVSEDMGGSPLALVVCFVPRILCGIIPYFVYKAIQNHAKNKDKSRKFSLLLAGVAGSLTNTILVMGMIYLFFGHQYAEAKNIAFEAVIGVIFGDNYKENVLEYYLSELLIICIRASLFLITLRSDDAEPAYSSASSAITGPSILHGPHQSA